jgi:hypothetical protein
MLFLSASCRQHSTAQHCLVRARAAACRYGLRAAARMCTGAAAMWRVAMFLAGIDS